MSRGRSRHQASRRRAYSVRQREIRERATQFGRDERSWTFDDWSVDEAEPLDPPASVAWTTPLPGRAGAA